MLFLSRDHLQALKKKICLFTSAVIVAICLVLAALLELCVIRPYGLGEGKVNAWDTRCEDHLILFGG
jgi:hypothetical protein